MLPRKIRFSSPAMAEPSAVDSDPTDDDDVDIPKDLLDMCQNFVLVTEPYDDDYYIQDLEPFVIDEKEDFKRIVHAFLLSIGQSWECQELKKKMKETYEFEDIRDVDKFVETHFKFKTFREFLGKADDIAVLEENDRFLPFLDDSNRDIFEDAQRSLKNKGDKERKKDDQIARTLDDPENVKGFYEGMNRLRQAIIKANESHMNKDGAITKISAMDGTDKQICGINASFVQSEYQNLFGVTLPADCKKICGRSTLMKALNQGRPKCLVETIAMENKAASDGAKAGMYIALKTTSHEYSEAEIEAAVEECRQSVSNLDRRRNNRDGREEKRYGRTYDPRERQNDDLRRQARQELENQRNSNVSQMASQTAPADSNIMRPSDDDDEFDDSEDEANYSDDDEGNEAKREKISEMKKKKEDKEKARTSAVPSPATSTPSSSDPPRPSALPSSSSAPLHDEVPYGQLPPAPYVLHYDDNDATVDDPINDALEAAAMAAMNTAAPAPPPTTQRAPVKNFVPRANQWEEEESVEQSVPQPTPQPVVAPPPPQPPQQTSSVFGPRPIVSETSVRVQEPQPEQQQQVSMQQSGMQPPMQQMQMHPNHGQQMQQSNSMPMQSMTPPPQGGQFTPQYAPSTLPPPNYQGDGMMVPPQQPQQGYWPDATPAHSQTGFGGMYSQAYSQVPLPNPPLGMMQHPAPFSPNYYNSPQYGPGTPSSPPNHPVNGAYQGQVPNYAGQSPIINVNVSLPPLQGAEFNAGPNYNNYPQPQSNGQMSPPLPQSYAGHPQVQQGAGLFQGAPQGHDHQPNQGQGYNGPTQGQFPSQGGGFPGRPQDRGYPTGSHGVHHSEDHRGRGYSGVTSPPSDYQSMHQFHNRGEPRREDRGFGRGCMERQQETRGNEGRRVDPPLRPMPRHYAEEIQAMLRESNRVEEPPPPFENGFPRPRQTTRGIPSNGHGVRREEGGFGRGCMEEEARGLRRDDRGGGRDTAGGGGGARKDDGGFGRGCMERERGGGGPRRNDDGIGRDQRSGYREQVDRRVETFGRPQGSSTPMNRTQERGMWNEIGRVNTPRKRIRWMVITILKNVRDENYVNGSYKRGANFEIVEVDALADLVMMGCGNDMELYEATAQYQDKPNPFLEFLKEMRDDNLIQLYTESVRSAHTIERKLINYVMDPYTKQPAHFRRLED